MVPSLEVLRAKAQEVGKALLDDPDIANLQAEFQVLVPQVEVCVRQGAAARFGLTPGDMRRAALTLVMGTKVGEIYEEQKIFENTARGVPAVRESIDAVRQLRIDTP